MDSTIVNLPPTERIFAFYELNLDQNFFTIGSPNGSRPHHKLYSCESLPLTPTQKHLSNLSRLIIFMDDHLLKKSHHQHT